MKAGIMTFHMAHNYGAMLQAYALRRIISNMGIECEIIDYRLEHIYRWHRLKTRKMLCRESGFMVGNLRWVKRLISGYYGKNTARSRFHKFMLEDMGISSKQYLEDDLTSLSYDAYICGSDQIWNQDLTDGLQGVYFLDFVKQGRKIAYAASRGKKEIGEDSSYFRDKLADFQEIGVREEKLCEELRSIGIQNCVTVLDPTLLLDGEMWSEIRAVGYREELKGYILVYSVKTDKKLIELARQAASEKAVPIVYLTYERMNLDGIIEITDAGPKEFIELFKRSLCVITNSFHGTCFSILFKKVFAVYCGESEDPRLSCLLNKLELENHIVDLEWNGDIPDIDYNAVGEKLKVLKGQSIQFLEKALKE